ncbi:hypothetical protein L3Y34_006010 [Caenorhabditis briggsae]|uniref:glucuronosyltransferase n=1 Tax=Caenorhabditis briggsae TaxID=6238 RepID=A0AAE8ZT57_CAEBR|nr:hypothetical protein L3Y34_006010 [Caenorhabditis briggsae]
MVPIFGDQLINAKMLSRHGGSIAFNKYKLENSEELSQVIREALCSSAIRSSAQRLAEILRNQPVDPKTNLLRHAEFSAKFGRVESLQPYNVHYNFVQFYMLDGYVIIIMFISLLVYISYLVTLRIMRKCFFGRKTEKLE